jgi:1,4-dihydroxy-2-naphthoyl-CoA synthase
MIPGMDGFRFCFARKDKNIQKILLTGAADEEIAIDAFNTGCINRFLRKRSCYMEDDTSDNISRST